MIKILVCGGRDYSERRLLYEELDKVHAENQIAIVITGGARGADSLAVDWASIRNIQVLIYNANWKTHGRKAGPLRNQRMIDEGEPDLVIAFPGGKGTADMVRRAKIAKIAMKLF